MGRFFIKWWAWAIGLICLGLGAAYLERHGYERAKNETLKAQLEASEKVRVLEAQLQTKVTQVEIRYVERKKTASKEAEKTATAVTDFNTTVDSLPVCPQTVPDNPTTTIRVDESPTADLLKVCAGNLADLARVADELANQVTGLQDYINSVRP